MRSVEPACGYTIGATCLRFIRLIRWATSSIVDFSTLIASCSNTFTLPGIIRRICRQAGKRDPGVLPLLRRARALAANFPQEKSWGWKEPRASLFLPFWRQALPNMSFLFCLRNPLEVAESLQKRNRMAIEHGCWLWYLYTLTSLRDTQGCPRQFSFFDDYFAHRDEEIARVLDFCGLGNFNDAAVLESAIEGELRHHEGGDRRLRDEPAVPAHCKDLYFGLRSILAVQEQRREIPNAANGAGASSAVDSFIAPFTGQAGFEYLSQRRPAAASSGQRIKKFLNSMRSR